jgi:hypothetical protein
VVPVPGSDAPDAGEAPQHNEEGNGGPRYRERRFGASSGPQHTGQEIHPDEHGIDGQDQSYKDERFAANRHGR